MLECLMQEIGNSHAMDTGSIFWLQASIGEKAIDLLLKGTMSNGDKESLLLALRFVVRVSSEKGFNELIETQQFDECDFLNLLRKHDKKWHDFLKPSILKLIWNNLNENTKISPDEFNFPLDKYLEFGVKLNDFQLIWNNKHLELKPKWINEFLLNQFMFRRDEIINFLVPKCDLSLPTTYFLKGLNIITEFRNCCWLQIISAPPVRRDFGEIGFNLDDVQKQFGIKWSEELLEWTLKVVNEEDRIFWLLENSSIDSLFWNSERKFDAFITCCDTSTPQAFEKVMSLWSSCIDVSANGNKGFRSLLSSSVIGWQLEPIFSKLESKIRFSDSKEREEMVQLAKGRGHSEYIERIQTIKLINQ